MFRAVRSMPSGKWRSIFLTGGVVRNVLRTLGSSTVEGDVLSFLWSDCQPQPQVWAGKGTLQLTTPSFVCRGRSGAQSPPSLHWKGRQRGPRREGGRPMGSWDGLHTEIIDVHDTVVLLFFRGFRHVGGDAVSEAESGVTWESTGSVQRVSGSSASQRGRNRSDAVETIEAQARVTYGLPLQVN